MGRRGPKKTSELYDEIRAARRGPMRGEVYAIRFPDGSVERVPRALWDAIGRNQRAWVKAAKGGKLGGRPSRRPSDRDLLLAFGEHWLNSGQRYAKARDTFRARLRSTYDVRDLTARRWSDSALGRKK